MLTAAVLVGCHHEQQILAGGGYACLLDSTSLTCQLNGDSTDAGETVAPARKWDSVVAGFSHLCGMDADGVPHCWGWDSSGQSDIPDGLSIASFFLGYENTCVLQTDGTISCWGSDWTGLNDAPRGSFVQAAAAERVACARTADLEWTCWGQWWGIDETDDGYTFDWSLPDVPLVEIAGESLNICGLDEDGAIYCWGNTNFGVTSPPDGTGYHDLSVGTAHACAMEDDDQVVCWGSELDVWRKWPSDTWRAFDAGPWVDCGIRDDGEIECWGCVFTDPFTCDWDD